MNDINVPVVTPNPVQFQPPTDLVNAYLNRQQANTQDTLNRVTDLGTTLNNYKQQKIQNQLNALAAYSGIAKAVGPDAANQVAGNIPNMPAWSSAYQSPNTQTAAPVGGANGQAINPGQTAPSASSQGSPQTLGDQPQVPSQAIQASLQAGHPDYTGQLAKLQNQMGQFQNKGDWGREQQQQIGAQVPVVTAQMEAEKLPGELAKQKNDVAMLPTKNAKEAQDLSNSQQQVPVEIGGKSAEVQKDYGSQDVKIQQGVKALQDLKNAWAAVPSIYKGPLVGQVTSRAGAGSSTLAPEVVKFNNAHANAATVLATALLPENARANPLMVEEVRKTIPTLAYGQKAFDDGISGFEDQLKNNADLNYKNHQSQASEFGGNVTKSKPQGQPQLPPVGGVYKGHIYLGGDPSKQTSWKAQ